MSEDLNINKDLDPKIPNEFNKWNKVNFCLMNMLEKDYKDVYDWQSRASRDKFFEDATQEKCESNFKRTASLTNLTVKGEYEELRSYNYLWFREDDYDGNVPETNVMKYFFFIDDMTRLTQETTEVKVTLDIWTTYQFEYTMMASYIERCHLPRWKDNGFPHENVIIEDDVFAYGENILIEKEKICDFKDSVVITTSVPVGKLGWTGANGTGTSSSGSANTETADAPAGTHSGATSFTISRDGLRYMKGREGFVPTGFHDNGEPFNTGGYGVTEKYEPEWYNKLKPFPCSEQTASQVLNDMINTVYAPMVKARLQHDGIDLNKVTQSRFDCMLFWITSAGASVFNSHVWTLIKNNIDDPAIPDAIRKYAVTSATTGRTLPGLVDARSREADIWQKGEYRFKEISIMNQYGKYTGVVSGNNGYGYTPSSAQQAVPVQNHQGTHTESGMPVISNAFGKMIIPAHGIISAGYPKYPNGTDHRGIDIANVLNTPIYAPADGTVTKSADYQAMYPRRNNAMWSYGNLVEIDHGNGWKTRMAHMKSRSVSVGDHVKQGQLVGHMNSTGNSTGNHTHFEVLHNNQTTNPIYGHKVGQRY